MEDVVARYIELKEEEKERKKELDALKTVILEEHREDERIKIVKGREIININADTYENLESINIPTKVTEERYKTIDEFDVDVQQMILDDEKNYTKKEYSESIRIVKI